MDDAPYLSFVVTSRNDDHGGNLLRRMQAFVDGLISQCQRHHLDAELIIVEWNPPADRPRLIEALHWPEVLGPLRVRFFEVPIEMHRQFPNADKLPLFQMIGKNVGIRRARGQFILATNIDILFSDELMAWLAARHLETGRMYRMDRHDVVADVPADASLDKQLEWCRDHLLRVNTRDGTFPLTADGQPALFPADIVSADDGLVLTKGWSPIESQHGERCRWLGNEGAIVCDAGAKAGSYLSFDVEPGPGVRGQVLDVELRGADGNLLGEGRACGRQIVSFHLENVIDCGSRLLLQISNGGLPANEDFRTLNGRVFRCALGNAPLLAGALKKQRHDSALRRCWNVLPNRWRSILKRIWGRSRAASDDCPWLDSAVPDGSPHSPEPNAIAPVPLHLGTSGDFTLMARAHWFAVRGNPEWPVFPLHVDSLLCYQAHHAGARETVLTEPMRIYHIEHARGTGGTFEDIERLCARLRADGIPFPTAGQVLRLATQMRRLGQPLLGNSDDWGLAQYQLPETSRITARVFPVATT